MRSRLLATLLLFCAADGAVFAQGWAPWPSYPTAYVPSRYPNYPYHEYPLNGYYQGGYFAGGYADYGCPGYPFPSQGYYSPMPACQPAPWPMSPTDRPAYYPGNAYPPPMPAPAAQPVTKEPFTQQALVPGSGQRSRLLARLPVLRQEEAKSAPEQKPPQPEEVLPKPRSVDAAGQVDPDIILTSPDDPSGLAPNCPPCAPRGYRYYGRAEYLLWWTRNQSAPTLLTAGNPPATLVGGELDFADQPRHGGRFSLGRWLNDSQTMALEVVYFFLGTERSFFETGSGGEPILARPFVNAVTGQPMLSVVGQAEVEALSRLWNVEANFRGELCRWAWGHLDALAGLRYLEFDENINVLTASRAAGLTTLTFDGFGTHNRFVGGQLGLETEVFYRKCFLDAWAKLGLGDNTELVNIQGNQVIGGRLVPGGLLAQPSNIGRHRRNQLACIPEVAINIGYQLQDHVRATIGYNFLFLGEVVRPGNQIDTRVNTTGAGPSLPAFMFHQGSFWAHGFIAGLEFRF